MSVITRIKAAIYDEEIIIQSASQRIRQLQDVLRSELIKKQAEDKQNQNVLQEDKQVVEPAEGKEPDEKDTVESGPPRSE